MSLLLLLSVLFQMPSDQQVAMSFSSYFGGERFEFSVSRAELENLPPWLPDSPAPPLAIRDAVSAGRTKLTQLLPSAAAWRLHHVALHPTQVENIWVYAVQFTPTPPTVAGGVTAPFRIMVLMDGRAVEPNRTVWKR
jgi:hypothetical protein